VNPARPRFVLLPGLDGTGHYSQVLEQALLPHGEVLSLSYPCDTPLGYASLLEHLAPKLPRERHLIVAESFGGPLALMLAERRPAGLSGLVLASTFACMQWPLKGLVRALAERVPPGQLPARLTSRLLWGDRDSLARRLEMRAVTARVRPEVLSLRSREALRVDRRAGSRIGLPALVMRGRRDRLIGPRSSATLDEVLVDVERVDFDAPHFVFQAQPDATAKCIVDFATRRVFGAEAAEAA
jgi:pimeloyl-[acyl-carrier protein] methyl ester esterase